MTRRSRNSLFSEDREPPERKLRRAAAAMDHGYKWVVLDILRSREQVMGGQDDFQVRALPTDTLQAQETDLTSKLASIRRILYMKQIRWFYFTGARTNYGAPYWL